MDSERSDENFIVIEVSDEEFNSAICEIDDKEESPKRKAKVNVKRKLRLTEESEESGIHSEEINQSPGRGLLSLCRGESTKAVKVKDVGEEISSSCSYEDAGDDTDVEGALSSDSGDGDGEDSEDSQSEADETSGKDSDEATSDSDDTGDVRSDGDSDDVVNSGSDESDPVATDSDDSDGAEGSSSSADEDNVIQNKPLLQDAAINDVPHNEKMDTDENYDFPQTEQRLKQHDQSKEDKGGKKIPSQLGIDIPYIADEVNMEQSHGETNEKSPFNQVEGEVEGSPNSAICGSSPCGSLESSSVVDEVVTSPEGEIVMPNSDESGGCAEIDVPVDSKISPGSTESSPRSDTANPGSNDPEDSYLSDEDPHSSPPTIEVIEHDSISPLGTESPLSDNVGSPESEVSQNADSNDSYNENGSPQFLNIDTNEENKMDTSDTKTTKENPGFSNRGVKYYEKLKGKNSDSEADDESSDNGEWSDVDTEDPDSSNYSFDTSSDSSSEVLNDSDGGNSDDSNENKNRNRVAAAVADVLSSSDSWGSLDSDDSWDSEDLLLSDSDSEVSAANINTNNEIKTVATKKLSMGSLKDVYGGESIERMEIEPYDDASDNWEDIASSNGEEDEERDGAKSNSSDGSNYSGFPNKKMKLDADVLYLKNDCKLEEQDEELLNENVINKEESSTTDDESINGDENVVSEGGEESEIYQNCLDECLQTRDSSGTANLHLMKAITKYKPQGSSVEEFSKKKMHEYLMNRRFLNSNLDENEEKTIDAKNLAEIISVPQDNHLNAISFGPDYEPEEIKVGLNSFWKFYHDLKNKNKILGSELTPFLIPLLIHFETELISGGLISMAQELYQVFGDKFMSESSDDSDEELKKELKLLAEVKDQEDVEVNENLQSLVDRKYSFELGMEIHEMLAKFLARVETPVLINVFTDNFIVQLKFPEIELMQTKENSIEEFDTDEEEDLREEEGTKEEDQISYDGITEAKNKSVSYADEVIRRLRKNPIVSMPSITVYSTTGDPVCGAMSAQGTTVAYGMKPAGIRLCQTNQTEYFSEEDKETENEDNPSYTSIKNLNAHEGCVYGLGFHPKTKLMFSVGYDGYMRAWDLRKVKPSNRCVYSGHVGPIWAMDVAASGTMVVTGGMDSTARLWLPEKHEYARLFVGHYFDINCVKFHPNEAYVATGSVDKTVRLWSVGDGNMMRIFTGCPGTVSALSFHESGRYLAAGGEDDIIRLWDIAEGDLLCELPTLPTTNRCKDLSFCGNKLAGCFEGNKVQIWDLKKVVGGDDVEEEKDVVKFYEEFGEKSSDDGNCTTIPAPFSISSKTEYLFKIYYKDSANVFCLGADEKTIKISPFKTKITKPLSTLSPTSPEASYSNLSTSSLSSDSPRSEDDDYPFNESPETEKLAEIDIKDGDLYCDSIERTNLINEEAPSTMSADDIEEDTVRTEVATYDRLFSSTRRDDDSWLTL